MRMQTAGLALGGGAARGWAHIGVIRALAEKNIRITHIAGTSIGAFVGAFVATGTLAALERELQVFDWKHGLSYFASVPSKAGMLNGRKISEFLELHLGAGRLEETDIPLSTVAVDLRSGREITFSTGNIIEAVRASIAVPGIFTPVKKGEMFLADGGLVNPVPVSTVRSMGAKRVIAVDLNRVSIAEDASMLKDNDPNLLDIIGASANIIQAGLTRSRLAVDPPDVLIRPPLAHITFVDFTRGEECIELGYRAALESLARHGV